MNYEEKYKKALKSMRDLYNKMKYLSSTDALATTVMLENTFPELRESEDEKIRKEIISFLENIGIEEIKKIPRNICEWFAWLEKQGEKKDTVTPQWMIDFLKEHRRSFATPMDYDEKQETDGKLLTVIKWLEGNPQLEQKTAWSEEDERICQCLIKDQEKALDDVRNDKYGHSEIISDLKEMYRERIDWLKSIKPNHWKPSEEQMQALKYIIDFHSIQKITGILTREQLATIKSLYDDLKKL